MVKAKIYSPAQVAASTFIGGPGAMMFVLKRNFDAMGNRTGSKKTIIWGSLFIVFLLLLLPFLPEKFPNFVLPLAYTFAARMVAEKHQMSKQAILDSQQFEFQSGWNVFGISVGFLAASLIVLVLWMVGLQILGIVKLDAV